ncbi:MAG TPA: DUF4097 family beta strand repeat-containing protein [Ktedonobacterales bacterium]|nr:DUF4097 family beta strand repeat-containing protein [Ktedonobacterales bacterium]
MLKATATESQSFTVTENPSIVIENPVGAVNVVAGEVGQVTVRAIKEARNISEEAAYHDLEEITVRAEQNGNTITIQVDLGYPFPSVSQRSVKLLVTVPERADLHADVKVGNLHTYGLMGRVQAQVATGQAELRRVTLAEESRLLVHTGHVDLDGALTTGASLSVQIHVGSADLRLPAATYAHLDASTHIGHIDVSGWPVMVRRSFLGAHASGDMGAEPVGALNVRTDVGSVTVSAYS